MFTPLILPNGSRLPNRLAKAALEENLADEGQLPGPALWRLYRHWGIGGAGLIITGNVMIDGRAMTGPGGVVLEQDTPLEAFKTWAAASRQEGAQVWMQLSHPGRQVMANMGGNAWAPSAIPMAMGKYSKAFAQPEAMSEAQIAEVIARFAASAHAAEKAGFTGVQIHAAHGYLISQFLSPLANRRSDRWGGELANRARLLLEVVRAVRQRVSPDFCVAVKLNSADFQRGGFSPDEARQVLLMLNELPVDLVELSGGSYESPAMQGEAADDSTLAREAYFLTFARDLAAVARMPVMTTGGIARPSVAQRVLNSGVAVVGIATAMAEIPDLPRRWQTGEAPHALPAPVKWRDKTLTLLARMALIKRRMYALSRDRTRNVRYSPLWSLLIDRWRTRRTLRRYHAWLRQR
ncbi:NADH:flavin oxidoreductase/NADH oxidase family protein [Serratia ureilytica]|uniref:NADH:flavin oxidoreductase/NADH oxidase family protein n=1 Tax=Serratia ureilytica TaxID=300181 RepID=A0ABU0VIE6_9GAMM|nr:MULTISPECIES: NADH:flavin oxidoreductase/NADH oxidase family protein [Serratia]MBH1900393.1 NADH:flavin oxidoreductase/NADH oxidase family protein [Serratia ureilytica]MBH2801101.1 NADH:flavin oxidoreductase/NADH oxidase family protein [Serratia ureilytica]MBH2820871.1 NADH:flavin oxidoreductase/NADH oxidase family protein [Serratia ureilytica]MBH3116546.1 NADH:flavin oxidoreductase/NADH oxidase family protein [Serratia ureilytica]MCU7060528.1 NADH:flavin oxidoreductase/NADH oxidase family 